MHEMMEVAKYMRRELEVADSYAYEATKHKASLPEMAHHYYKAALEHMLIADMLCEGAARMVDDMKRNGHADTDRMVQVWTFERDMATDRRECIQRKLDMYKA